MKLGGRQGTDAAAFFVQALARIVAKTVEDVGLVPCFEGCGIKDYLETGLHDCWERPKRLSRAKLRGTFERFSWCLTSRESRARRARDCRSWAKQS